MIDTFREIEKLEADLWEAADNLRAKSQTDIDRLLHARFGRDLLRHAANRFQDATRQIEEDKAAGRMPNRKVLPED